LNTSYLKAVWTIFNTLPDKRGTGNGADFYRLVGAHGYDKTERAYERLSEALNRARRARLIPMASIRDGGGARVDPDFWRDTDQFLRSYRAAAERFRLDRQHGQPTRLLLLCEAAGMVPQLARAVDDYGLRVISASRA
jgi:hypothetical protein